MVWDSWSRIKYQDNSNLIHPLNNIFLSLYLFEEPTRYMSKTNVNHYNLAILIHFINMYLSSYYIQEIVTF